MLHWQSDPAESAFVVGSGSLKDYSVLPDVRAHAHRALNVSGLAGATAQVLGHNHDTLTQALGEVQVSALQLSEFDRLLRRNSRFAPLLISKLA